MAILSNRQLWEMGVPLDSAWLEFASDDVKRRHSELPTLAKFNEQAKAANVQSGSEILNLYSSGMQQWQERLQFENELREALLVELFNDQLHAFAYRLAPSRSRSPVRIAAELFDLHDPAWQSESLSARGMEYAEIRIVDPASIAKPLLTRTGRKGSAVAIRNAIAVLQAEGVDLCGPRKLACDAIRRKIGGSHEKGAGLTDTNLAKYIVEICGKRSIGN